MLRYTLLITLLWTTGALPAEAQDAKEEEVKPNARAAATSYNSSRSNRKQTSGVIATRPQEFTSVPGIPGLVLRGEPTLLKLDPLVSERSRPGDPIPNVEIILEEVPGGRIKDALAPGVVSYSAAQYVGVWTPWLNRDRPGGSGDYETLSEFKKTGKVCTDPLGVQCQTVSGTSWEESGQRVTCTPLAGAVCRNGEDQVCKDYRVRFLCPATAAQADALASAQ